MSSASTMQRFKTLSACASIVAFDHAIAELDEEGGAHRATRRSLPYDIGARARKQGMRKTSKVWGGPLLTERTERATC